MFDKRKVPVIIGDILEEKFHDISVLIQKNVYCICDYVGKKHSQNFDFKELTAEISDIENDFIECFVDTLSKKLEEFKLDFGLCVSNSLLEIEKHVTRLSDEYIKFEEALEDYLVEKVIVDEKKMKITNEKLQTFILALQDYLKEEWPEYPVGEFILAGSVADGTKVCLPNEFDLMMPLILPTGDFISHEQPNNHLLKVSLDYASHQHILNVLNNRWLCLTEFEKQIYVKYKDKREMERKYYLSPELISEKIKDILVAFKDNQVVIEKLASYDIKLDFARSEHFYKFGPAIDILVVYEGAESKGSFVIDIVPYIQEREGKGHVINPYYTESVVMGVGKAVSYIGERFADPTIFWRRSHSSLETKLFQHLNVRIQKPLMIWKSFALLNIFLKNPILNSFHFKNIVLLLAFKDIEKISTHWDKNNDNNDELFEVGLRPWSEYPLGLQVIEIARMMCKFLKTSKMPWASHRSVNVTFKPNNKLLLKKHDIDKIRRSMIEYLEEILANQNWCRLISDSYLKVEENECPFSGKKV